jgi:peptidyl-prolyl cis-trans isomerase A (cyclophilin A)
MKKTKKSGDKMKYLPILLIVAAAAVLYAWAGTRNTQETAITAAPRATEEKMKETAVLETTKGNIEIELDREKAPKTVENFVGYVNSGQFDGTVFHRVISDFMIQGGGFTPDGNQKPTRPPIRLESDNGLKNAKGTIAMARTNDPNSATCQFFINVKDNGMLDYSPGNPGYAVFGKVASGMDTVEKIRTAPTTTKGRMADWPAEDIIIKKAYMKK